MIRNLKWGLVYQIVNMLMGFITPRIIMMAYGSEINGLQNSILQIINIIALLQAGITSASVFLMYKPISEGDNKEVSDILQSAVLYFRRIAYIFFASMLIAAFIFTFTMKSDLQKLEIFIAFLILGTKTTLDIFLVSKYLIIFTADQNKYIVSIANLTEKLVYYILLFAIVAHRSYFILMYIGLIAGTISKIVLYKYIYKKVYGCRFDADKQSFHPVEISGKNYSMINEISHTVVVSSAMIIVSSLYNLKSASVYSVYYLVISLLITIDVVIYESYSSSFGNLVANGDVDRVNDVFATFQMGFNMINTFMYMCAAYLIVPFVQIYTSGVTDMNYTNYFMSTMIIIFGAVYTYRIPYNICVSSYGRFKETGIQPLVCCILSIIISIILGTVRMELVVVGPIFFYAINYLYQIVTLKRLIPELIFDNPIVQFITSISCIVLALIMSQFLKIAKIGIIQWLIIAVVTAIISACVTLGAFLVVNKKRCIYLLSYIRSILSRRRKL